jgi:hypothetical protein
VRVQLLRARPLWHDEAFTAWIARRSPSDLVAAMREDSGPPLFYVLERPFALAASTPARDPLLRLLPLVASLALFACAGSLPRGESRAWWIVLCSGFALVNLYAAEARTYAMLALACLGVFLLGVLARETAGKLLALFLVAAAALWLHYLAFFAVGMGLILALASGRVRSALVLAAAGAAFLPWFPILLGQPAAAMSWVRETPSDTVVGFFSALGGMGRVPAPFGAAPPRIALLATAAVGAAMVVVLAGVSRNEPSVRAALLFVAGTLGLAGIASLWRPIAFAGRSELAVLPVWMWGIARALPGRRAVRIGATISAALGFLASLSFAAGPHPRSTAATAVARVSHLARPGDLVLAGPGLYLPALLDADRGLLTARVMSLPAGDASHPGWFASAAPGPGDAADLRAAMGEVPAGARLWLLIPASQDSPEVMRVLSSTGTVRELVRQADAVMLVWSPASEGAAKISRIS